MTEESKAQWKIVTCPGATYVEIPGKSSVRFLDEDREANARLFLRAQYMGKLELEVRKLCAYVEDLPTEEMVSGMPIVKRIDAILAKIGGGE